MTDDDEPDFVAFILMMILLAAGSLFAAWYFVIGVSAT